MAARQALWIPGGGGIPDYDAIDDRSFLGAILAGNFFDTVTAGLGSRGRGHGVLAADAMAITAGGGQNVSVAAGMASVRGSASGQLGAYVCANDAATLVGLDNRTVASQGRKDLIIARVRDNTYGIAGNDWIMDKITGTHAVSPVDPTVPANSAILVLARVNVPAGATGAWTVAAPNIEDLRPHARAIGGITPVSTVSAYPNPEDFDFVWEISTSILKMRLNGAWVEVGRDLDANWTSVTPNWAGSFTLGNGDQYLRYVQWGTTVTGVAGFTRQSTSTMSGPLMLDLDASGLPPVEDPGSGYYMAGGRMFDASAVKFWSVAADIDPADGRIKNFATQGAAVWSPTSPVNPWATGDQLRIFFNYEAI